MTFDFSVNLIFSFLFIEKDTRPRRRDIVSYDEFHDENDESTRVREFIFHVLDLKSITNEWSFPSLFVSWRFVALVLRVKERNAVYPGPRILSYFEISFSALSYFFPKNNIGHETKETKSWKRILTSPTSFKTIAIIIIIGYRYRYRAFEIAISHPHEDSNSKRAFFWRKTYVKSEPIRGKRRKDKILSISNDGTQRARRRVTLGTTMEGYTYIDTHRHVRRVAARLFKL